MKTAGFISEDSYLGDITDPLTLNRYNYVKGSPLNYMDPSGHSGLDIFTPPSKYVHTGDIPVANDSNASYDITKKANTEAACSIINLFSCKQFSLFSACLFPIISVVYSCANKAYQYITENSRTHMRRYRG